MSNATEATEVLHAYHDSQELKDLYLDRIREHRRLEHLIQGEGWVSNGVTRGCAVGCTLEKYDHGLYPVELGIPRVLAHLEDRIFEGLPWTDAGAKSWPERFLSAIRPGADLSLVWPKFAVWLLEEHLAKWRTPASDAVVALYRRRIAGDEPTSEEWMKVRAAAAAAAYDAYDAYDAYAAARAAADAAYAYDAAYAAAAAADAAAYAAAYAHRGSYEAQSIKILSLLSEAW